MRGIDFQARNIVANLFPSLFSLMQICLTEFCILPLRRIPLPFAFSPIVNETGNFAMDEGESLPLIL